MLPALARFLQHDDLQILSKSFEMSFYFILEEVLDHKHRTDTAIFIFHFFSFHRLADAAYAINYITNENEDGDRIQVVIDNGCVPSLVKLLGQMDYSVVNPALRSVGNIVMGTDTQVSECVCVCVRCVVDLEMVFTCSLFID